VGGSLRVLGVTALGRDTQYRNNENSLHPIPLKNTPHILYSSSVSQITTWRWPTYRTETCSCIPTILLGEIYLCSTVCLIHKNSFLLNQHNGDDTPQHWGFFFKVYSFRSAVFCRTGSPLLGCGYLTHTDGLGRR